MQRSMRLSAVIILILGTLLSPAQAAIRHPEPARAAAGTFHNPVADAFDPTAVTDNGSYYLIGTSGSTHLGIRKSATVAGLRTTTPVIVWSGKAGELGCCRLWSPVLQKVRGSWYIYLSVTNSDNVDEITEAAVFVLVSSTGDPLGPYELKAKMRPWTKGTTPGPWPQGRVGPSVTEMPDGRLYFTATTFGFYIQQMTNPWTLASNDVVQLNDGLPDFDWEGARSEISRPFIRTVNGSTKVFVPYTSESHLFFNRTNGGPCWSFCVGMFTNTDGNLLNPTSWVKSPTPVFAGGPSTGLYRVLALGTFKSPDGTEDWLVYNASDAAGSSYGERDTFLQRFTFRPDGTPNFGNPEPLGKALTVPSGEVGSPPPVVAQAAFDFSNGADGWTPVRGSWAPCSGRYCATGQGENLSLTGELSWTDYTIQAKVTADNSPNNSGVNVVARAASGDQLFNLELARRAEGQGRWVIAKNAYGTWSVLASGDYSWSAGQPYWLRLDVNAGKLTALISKDGVAFDQLGVVTLGGRVAPGDFGKVGLRTWGGLTANFDDVIVTPNKPSWGFYSGPGWPGLTIDAGAAVSPDYANSGNFCENTINDYCVGGQALDKNVPITGGPLGQRYYQTEKWGDTRRPDPLMRNDGSFRYVIPSLVPHRGYTIRLHFAEIHYNAAGDRRFDVRINGNLVLDEFDKVAAAGGPRKAVVRQFTGTADQFGHLTIAFLPGSTPNADHNPTVSAIQILPT